MFMKDHILAALREQVERWEETLAGLSDAQVTAPLSPDEWLVKDVMAHLMAWQQRSTARLEAARDGRDPQFPVWVPGDVDPDTDEYLEAANAFIYQTYHEQPWSDVHRAWREGYLRLIELGALFSERDLLDGSRYPWLDGYPLAFVLIASYDHHQEHLDTLLAWLGQRQT